MSHLFVRTNKNSVHLLETIICYNLGYETQLYLNTAYILLLLGIIIYYKEQFIKNTKVFFMENIVHIIISKI